MDLNTTSTGMQTTGHTPGYTPGALAIAWIDLKFSGQSVLPWKPPKAILNGISGSVDFGSLTALMGPSGCGKSTLLKCINGRNMEGLDSGTKVYLSSAKKIRSCFIVQDISEHLWVGLTGIQSLTYASKLKNVREHQEVNHRKYARKLLSDLSIGDTEGTNMENCSGGEQKRLAIAQELMALRKPNLMCIDEPTSGLDSNAAEIVVQVLKSVARQHEIAIVTSIHQPNNDTLMLFDGVYVLAKGGLCVYSGPPQEVRAHLSAAQFECNEHQVPIEVLLRIASKYGASLQRLSHQSMKARSELRLRCLEEGHLAPNGVVNKGNAFQLRQMWYLLGRTMTCQLRSQWKAMFAQFLFIQTMGFLVTRLYNKHVGETDGCFSLALSANASCVKTVEGLREENLLSQNLRYLYFVGVLIMALMSISTVLLFSSEIKIFMNERMNGWYSTGSYFLAKNIAEIPTFVVIVTIYVIMVYNVIPQIDDNRRFVGFLAVLLGGAFSGQGLGFLIGIVTNGNFRLAITMDIGILLLHIFFSGFFAPLQELPDLVQPVAHLSFVKQAFEMHLYIIYGFDRCPEGTVQSILYQNNLLDERDFWRNGLILTAHGLVLRVLAFLALYARTNSVSMSLRGRSPKKSLKSRSDSVDEDMYM